VFPECEHRNCARHIYANWHKTHKGEELKLLFWTAAQAYNKADYKDVLDAMKLISARAVEDFVSQNPRAFCRAFIDNTPKCEVIVNNIAETFNAYIVQARAKHIIYMLEDIRVALMERVVLKRASMDKSEDQICPRIRVKLEKEKDEARNCFPVPAGNRIFQVTHRLDTLHVDMNEGKCTCRKWDVTGIPCCHAVSCAAWLKEDPAKFVHPYLHKEHYLRSYEGAIFPCQGERHWPQHEFPLDPPPITIGPGRPKKNRKRDPHEDPKKPGKLSKHGAQMSCGICKQIGHNKKTCPDKDKAQQPQPKRGRGRPRIHPQQPQPQPESQQMSSQAQRGRGRPASRGRGRGVGRVRGRATGGSREVSAKLLVLPCNFKLLFDSNCTY
jgi:hypothetical protein